MNEAIVNKIGPSIYLNDVKKGDAMIEYEYGTPILVVLLEDPKEVEPGVFDAQAKDVVTGRIIQYRQTIALSHYGPKLYAYVDYPEVEIEEEDIN